MEVKRHIEMLFDIGKKHSGFGGDLKAADYISDAFEKAGLNDVSKEYFECTSWEFKHCDAEIIPDNNVPVKIKVLPYFFSSSTPAGGLKSEIIYIESIEMLKYISIEEMMGKTALLNEEDILEEQYAWFIEKGAAAILMITERESPVIGQLLIHDMMKFKRIPLLSIQYRDAEFIVRNNIKYIYLSVETDVKEHAKTCNVAGKIQTKGAIKNIIIGAHYDTIPLPSAAKDNSAGVAIILGVAEKLSHINLENLNIYFAAFSSEELNREGAFHYVKRHEKVLQDSYLMINVDGHGDYVGKNSLQIMGDNELEQFCRKVANEQKYPVKIENINICYLDNAFFTSQGIPSVFMCRYPNLAWHTLNDTCDTVSGSELEKAVEYIVEFILTLDNVDYPASWTVDRTIVERLNSELPHLNL